MCAVVIEYFAAFDVMAIAEDLAGAELPGPESPAYLKRLLQLAVDGETRAASHPTYIGRQVLLAAQEAAAAGELEAALPCVESMA